MCTTTRTKKVVVGLVLVNLLILAIYFSLFHRFLPLIHLLINCQVAVLQLTRGFSGDCSGHQHDARG